MTVDPSRCPLCGDANTCAMASGAATCWCFDAKVAPDALAAVPADARGVACVCRRCAEGTTAEERRRRDGLRWTRR